MGAIFDAINAQAAARAEAANYAAGLRAARVLANMGQGKPRPWPISRDEIAAFSAARGRTRNIRAIRSRAAAALGLLPSQTVQADPDGNGLRDFRIDFHRPNDFAWHFFDWRTGRYGIFASAFDLSAEKYFVVGTAHKERFRMNAAPTGQRTANVVGTDDQGEPIYEIVEDVQGAVLSHLRRQIARHIRPFTVDSPEGRALPEWGSTVDTVTFDQDALTRRESTNSTWAGLRSGSGTGYGGDGSISDTNAGAGTNSGTTTNRYDFLDRSPFEADLTAYSAPDTATLQLYIYASLATMGAPTAHICPSNAPVGTLAASDYNIGNHTYTSKGSIAHAAITTSQYNGIDLTLDLLNFGGVSKFVAIEDSDLSDSAPAWASGGNAWKYIAWRGTPYTGTDQDPYLELTTAAAAAAAASNPTAALLAAGAI